MNVVLLTIDAWRASHASFIDDDSRQFVDSNCTLTPHLDSFADDGVAFSQAVAHGPATPYAFPSLFTSTLPLEHGGYEELHPDRTLVTERLSDAGWQCAGFHSNPWLKRKYGYGRGYDQYVDVGEFSLPMLERGREILHDRFETDDRLYRFAQRTYRRVQGPLRRLTGSETEADRALERLHSAGDLQFVWAHLLTPHAPYEPPAKHQRRVGLDPVVSDPKALTTRAQQRPDSLSAAEKRTVRLLYAAAVSHVDEQIASVLERVTDDDLVIITADHGEALFEHGQLGHEPALYEELVRVPLLIRPPGKTRRRAVGVPVQHMDLAPTILDYADTDVPDGYTGRSLRPLLEETDDFPAQRPATMEVASTATNPGVLDLDALQIAVRTTHRKVYYRDGNTVGFDLETDPNETDPISEPSGLAWESLISALDDRRETVSMMASSSGSAAFDTDTERRLRDLGYLE